MQYVGSKELYFSFELWLSRMLPTPRSFPLDGPDDPRAATSLPAITPRRKIMES